MQEIWHFLATTRPPLYTHGQLWAEEKSSSIYSADDYYTAYVMIMTVKVNKYQNINVENKLKCYMRYRPLLMRIQRYGWFIFIDFKMLKTKQTGQDIVRYSRWFDLWHSQLSTADNIRAALVQRWVKKDEIRQNKEKSQRLYLF